MHRPLISVALPVYNGEKYLAEAIDSILAQTFTDFELIIIDDGSTDESLKILMKYQQLDSRIRLISRENKNLCITLNEIIDLAQGQWIARMDQDDIALPHRFARQLEWAESTGADICGSWVKLFGTADKRILKHAQTDEAIKMELLFCTAFAHPSVMMRTELVKKLRYDKSWEKCEDYDLWERAARTGWVMGNVPEVLLLYRQHATQISSNSLFKQQLLTQKIRHRYWLFLFEKSNLNIDWVCEVLKLRDPIMQVANMNKVDKAFNMLLKTNKGEEKNVVFDHMTRLYFRSAVNCNNITFRWLRLSYAHGYGIAVFTCCKLWALSVLKISPKSKYFHFLKRFYFKLARRF